MEDDETDPDTEKINVDIKTCIIIPIHARWLIAAIEDHTENRMYYQGLCTSRFKIKWKYNKKYQYQFMFFVI